MTDKESDDAFTARMRDILAASTSTRKSLEQAIHLSSPEVKAVGIRVLPSHRLEILVIVKPHPIGVVFPTDGNDYAGTMLESLITEAIDAVRPVGIAFDLELWIEI